MWPLSKPSLAPHLPTSAHCFSKVHRKMRTCIQSEARSSACKHVDVSVLRSSSRHERVGLLRRLRMVGITSSVTGRESLLYIDVKAHGIPLLDSYILAELVPPMILGVAAATALGIFMGAGPELGTLVGGYGVSWPSVLLAVRFFVLRVPVYVGFALPIASLLAPLLAFGRMEADNEILALRSFGVTACRLVRPVLVMFAGVTIFHLFLTEGVIPKANRYARHLKSESTEVYVQGKDASQVKLKIPPQPIIYLNYRKGSLWHLFYAHRLAGGLLLKATLVEMQAEDCPSVSSLPSKSCDCKSGIRLRRVVVAESSTWDASRNAWMFKNGAEYDIRWGGRIKGITESGAPFKDDMPASHSLPTPATYTLQSVCQFDLRYFQGLTSAPLELAKLQNGRNFDDMTFEEVIKLQQLLDASRNFSESRKLKVKLHQRMALPFSCLVFGVVGSLISLSLPRKLHVAGFVWMLAIVFTYYVVNVWGSLLGQLNLVNPFIGAWMPNLGGLLAILILLQKAQT